MKNRYTKKRNDTSTKGRRGTKNPRVAKKATKGNYNGIDFDSLEEKYILMWLFELKAQGYVIKLERAPAYLLSDMLLQNYAEQLVTKSRPKTQVILHGHSYTPEFTVTWDYKKARDKFLCHLGDSKKIENPLIATREGITVIEVKPSFDQNSMERLFKVNQKWMYQRHEVFVNLIKVKELFPKTFTPKEYLTTTTGYPRKMEWKPRSLFTYLNSK